MGCSAASGPACQVSAVGAAAAVAAAAAAGCSAALRHACQVSAGVAAKRMMRPRAGPAAPLRHHAPARRRRPAVCREGSAPARAAAAAAAGCLAHPPALALAACPARAPAHRRPQAAPPPGPVCRAAVRPPAPACRAVSAAGRRAEARPRAPVAGQLPARVAHRRSRGQHPHHDRVGVRHRRARAQSPQAVAPRAAPRQRGAGSARQAISSCHARHGWTSPASR